MKRIGFLATGSELVGGEILNTNGQRMAQQLIDLGCELGEHIVVDDNEQNIRRSLQFLLDHHAAVIISGGLGPTSDDRTRYLVAELAQEALTFYEPSWQRIVDRFTLRGLTIPENNRQQALFPKNAVVFANDHGSADAAHVMCQGKSVFMLPGPPRECLPIFEVSVKPALIAQGFTSDQRLYRWRLLGASESVIAESLDKHLIPYQLAVAYRASYPYLDIKLRLKQSDPIDEIKDVVEHLVKPYLVTTEHSNISTQLMHALAVSKVRLTICDLATQGDLAKQLINAKNQQAIQFVDQPSDLPRDHAVLIEGLESFWRVQPNQHRTSLRVTLRDRGHEQLFEQVIYLRGQESLVAAIEFAAHRIYQVWFA